MRNAPRQRRSHKVQKRLQSLHPLQQLEQIFEHRRKRKDRKLAERYDVFLDNELLEPYEFLFDNRAREQEMKRAKTTPTLENEGESGNLARNFVGEEVDSKSSKYPSADSQYAIETVHQSTPIAGIRKVSKLQHSARKKVATPKLKLQFSSLSSAPPSSSPSMKHGSSVAKSRDQKLGSTQEPGVQVEEARRFDGLAMDRTQVRSRQTANKDSAFDGTQIHAKTLAAAKLTRAKDKLHYPPESNSHPTKRNTASPVTNSLAANSKETEAAVKTTPTTSSSNSKRRSFKMNTRIPAKLRRTSKNLTPVTLRSMLLKLCVGPDTLNILRGREKSN